MTVEADMSPGLQGHRRADETQETDGAVQSWGPQAKAQEEPLC